jgi:hypothetical protein
MALVFKELGYDLHVATFSYGEPIQKCFKDNGIKVFNVLESALPYSEYDIAWCHHSPVLSHIVKQGVRLKNVILRTLSPYEPLEALPAYVDAVDIVLANSEETAERYYSEGWIKKEKIEVFPNSVLSDFFNESRLRQNQAISRIAVVSNHVPDELKKAVEIIRSRSVIVDILGRGGTPKLDRFIAMIVLADPAILRGETVVQRNISIIPVDAVIENSNLISLRTRFLKVMRTPFIIWIICRKLRCHVIILLPIPKAY